MTAEKLVLIADDDKSICTVLTQALNRRGIASRATDNAATLWRWVADGLGDVVVTDVVMPDDNGLDMIPRLKKLRPKLNIIVMSAQNTLLTAVKATERGAFDYLPKPFDIDDFIATVDRAMMSGQSADGDELPVENLPLIGRSPAMQDVYRVMARLMSTDLTVMIAGESGTGKELVARALHQYGRRGGGPFVAVNMAAIPRELIESELFGHEKGAFTGASQRQTGRFEQAQGGTLFLDEIGDMPPEAQTRLLRVLQEGEFTPIGGREPIAADVRIIAATHRDLPALFRAGQFREDLYYRLNVVPIRLPALRERAADVPELAKHFLAEAVRRGLPARRFSPQAMQRLAAHSWPGNVRELENLVQRLCALTAEDVISEAAVARELENTGPSLKPAAGASDGEGLSGAVERHLSDYFAAHATALPPAGLYDRVLAEVERPLIRLTLAATRGNQLKAAEVLGLNRNTLRKRIRDLGLEPGRSKGLEGVDG